MRRTTIIATGDSFITRRIPEKGYPGFDRVREIISGYDVRFNNLEITVHNKEGYPAAFSGGTWAMTSPVVLDDLTRYGFNVYNTANNHSLDYSHGGLLTTIKNLRERGLEFCGTGVNMAEAASPCYVEAPEGRVAIIGVCSSFHDSDMAGNQSIELPGRPGLNGLRYKTTIHVEPKYYETLGEIAKATRVNAQLEKAIADGYARPLPEGELYLNGVSFKRGDANEVHTAPNAKDMARIVRSIEEAKRQADYAFVSIHAHEWAGTDTTVPAEFLKTFARSCVDAGADAILGHGPHELRGIEIYKGKPIFYSLGNFVFETETVCVQPADAYENAGMANTTTVGEYINMRSHDRTTGYVVQPNIWRAVMAGITAEDGKITEVQLYPIDLHMEEPRTRIGVPTIAEGDDTLKYLAGLSAPYGTDIEIRDGVGYIRF